MKRTGATVCLLVLAIGIGGCDSSTEPAGSAGTTAPSQASQQKAFVAAVHRDFPNSAIISAKDNVALGVGVCLYLQEGKSVPAIVAQDSTEDNGKGLPQQFISALLVESTHYLCPKYRSIAENG